MTSKEFFGKYKFKDISIDMFNEDGEQIYEHSHTTFANVNPLIKNEVKSALEDYKKNWEQKGEPVIVKIFTTPAWHSCVINLKTKEKFFTPNN